MADSNIENDGQKDSRKLKLINLLKIQLSKIRSLIDVLRDNAGIFFWQDK